MEHSDRKGTRRNCGAGALPSFIPSAILFIGTELEPRWFVSCSTGLRSLLRRWVNRVCLDASAVVRKSGRALFGGASIVLVGDPGRAASCATLPPSPPPLLGQWREMAFLSRLTRFRCIQFRTETVFGIVSIVSAPDGRPSTFFFKGDYDVLDFNGWNRVYPDFDRLFRLCWVWFRC